MSLFLIMNGIVLVREDQKIQIKAAEWITNAQPDCTGETFTETNK